MNFVFGKDTVKKHSNTLNMIFQTSNIFYTVSKFLLMVLFVYTGSSKLLGHALFLNQLSHLTFIKDFAILISFIVPVLEIITALLIAFDWTQKTGLWLASLLMTFFTIYVGGMLILKSSLPCTCGGVIASMSWKQHLLFNLFFMMLSWNALCHYYKHANKNISTNKRKEAENL